MRPPTSARNGVKGPAARLQAHPGPVTLSPSPSPERLPRSSVETEGLLEWVRQVGDSRPRQEVVGDALQAPRGVQPGTRGGKGHVGQSQGGGHEDRPPTRQLALYLKSSAGTAGGEKPIKVTPWLGSTPRADVWLRRAAGRQVAQAWPPEHSGDRCAWARARGSLVLGDGAVLWTSPCRRSSRL